MPLSHDLDFPIAACCHEAGGPPDSEFFLNRAGAYIFAKLIDRLRGGAATSQPAITTAPPASAPSLRAKSIAAMELEDRVLFSATPVGSEVLVNTDTTGVQQTHAESGDAIAVDADGDVVVVFTNDSLDGSGNGVFAQRYNAYGVEQGAEFQVNSTSAGNQDHASVAMDDAGNFVVVWASENQDGDGWGVYGRRYNAAGAAQGGEFLVANTTAGDQLDPNVALDANGDFVVTWSSQGQDGDGWGVYARRFNAAGVAQGNEFLVNSTTVGEQRWSAVDMDSAGNFVITWSGQDADSWGIYSQRFDAAGVAQGVELAVNTTTLNQQIHSDVILNDDGSFAIAWTEDFGNNPGVRARVFDATDTAVTGEVQVNQHTNDSQFYPRLSSDSSGAFTVTWTSDLQDGDAHGVYARRFTAAGVALGDEFLVNTTTAGAQQYSSVAVTDNGDFLVAWSGAGAGDADGVFVQRYAAPLLWFTTQNDVTGSGAPGASSWSDGEMLALMPPNLAHGTNTSGTLSSIFNIDSFANDDNADIDDIHYVTRNLTVGGGANTFDLQIGDLLLTTRDDENFTSDNALFVRKDEIFVFRPTEAGDYSSGSFFMLLDNFGAIHGGTDTWSVTLVEQDTVLGDTTLNAGTFLFSRTGTNEHNDVRMFTPTGVGQGATAGTVDVLLEGTDLGFTSRIFGMDLVETEVTIGGMTLPSGSLLLTLEADDNAVGSNNLATTKNDIWYLTVTQTTLVSGTSQATATMFFDGSDVNIDTTDEGIDGFTLAGPAAAANNEPVNVVPGSQATAVSTPLVFSAGNGNQISVSDTDAGGNTVRVTLSVTNGSISLAGIAGLAFSVGDGAADATMTFTGAIADINTALDGLTYNPTGGFNGSASLQITTNDLGHSGAGGALSDTDTIGIQVGSTVFQQGTNGYTGTQDNELNSGDPNTSFGNITTVRADLRDGNNEDGPADIAQGLIRFDSIFGNGPGQIPYGSTILSATLTVYVIETSDSGTSVTLHRMLVNWDENSTWNSEGGGIQLNGTEAMVAADSSIASPGSSGFQTFSGLEAALQSWSNGATNHGWAVVVDSENGWEFNSSEHGTTSRRPYLTVSFTPPQPPVIDLDANNSSGAAGSNYNGSFTEGAGSVLIADADASVTDADSATLGSMTITITNLLNGGLESLTANTAGTSIVANYNAGLGVLTLSGNDTVARYQQVLRTVRYNNTSDTPNTTDRVITVVAADAYGNSNTATSTMSVAATNDAPVNTVPGAQAMTEDTTRVFSAVNGNQISVSDVDAGGNPLEVTLSVTNGAITLAGTAGLTFSNGDGTSDVTMTFTGTAAAINTALNGLGYTPTNNYNGPAQLTIATSDLGASGAGGAQSDTDIVAITVNAANDPPVNSVPPAQNTSEDTALVFSVGNGNQISVSDLDAGGNPLRVQLTVTNGTLTLSGIAGLAFNVGDGTADATMTFTGTAAAINTALNGLSYTPTGGFNGAAQLTIVTDDQGATGAGGVQSDTDNVAITVAAVNDPPVNSVPPAQNTNEDTPLVFSAGNGNQISISDIDAGGSPLEVTLTVTNGTLSLSGTAGLAFSNGDGTSDATMTFTGTAAAINAALNGMSYTPTGNYNGPAQLTITTDDQGASGAGGPLSDTDNVAISVNAINDPPVNAVPPAQSVVEDATLVFSAVNGNQISVSDLDAGGNPLRVQLTVTNGTLSLAGTAGLAFNVGDGTADATMTFTGTAAAINTALNGLIYSPTGNYNGPAQLTIVTDDQGATGGGGVQSDTDNIAITVNAVNDAPVNTVPGAQTIDEDTPLVFSAGNGNQISVSDLDAGASPLRVQLAVGNGTLTLSGTAGLAFITGDGTADATMTFTGTAAAINAALNGLRYDPSLNYNGPEQLSITLDDQGATGLGGALNDVDTVDITVNAVNDPPINSVPAAQTTNEDTVLVFSAAGGNAITVSDLDVGGNPLEVTLALTGGTLTLSGTGGLVFSNGDGADDATMTFVGSAADVNAALDGMRYNPTLNFHGLAQLTIESNDQGATGIGGVLADIDTVDITVAAVNDAPALVMPGPQIAGTDGLVFSVAGGNPLIISDVDGSPVTVTLRAEGGTISLSQTTGLTFLSGDGTSDVSMIVTGDIAALNAALDGLRFDAELFESSLLITVNDGGDGGLGGPLEVLAQVEVTRLPPLLPIQELLRTEDLEAALPFVQYHLQVDDNLASVERMGIQPGGAPQRNFHRGNVAVMAAPLLLDPTLRSGGLLATVWDSFDGSGADSRDAGGDASTGAMGERFDWLWSHIDAMSDQFDEQLAYEPLVVGAVAGVSAALSAGYVVWLIRGGSLLASLLSSLPMWHAFDPLPVLEFSVRGAKTSDDEELVLASSGDDALPLEFSVVRK